MATAPAPTSLTGIYEAAPSALPSTDDDAVRFLALLARAYAAVDEIPARIEEGIDAFTARFGFEGAATATGTSIFLSIARGELRHTEVIRVRSGSPDFTRAVALHRLLERVDAGELTARDAADRLERLLAWRPPSSLPATVVASALLSASSALLLRADRVEFALIAVLGAVVGGVLHLVGGRAQLQPLATVLLAAVASAAAHGFDVLHLADIRPVPVLVAALVILFPGWRLTVAMSELAQGHWTSGSGRFMAAVTTLLLLVTGVVVGQQVVDSPERARLVLPAAGVLPAWARVLSPLAAGLAMTWLFDARRRDTAWIMLTCVVTSTAAALGGRWLGSSAGAFVGAFTATAVSGILARHLRLPYAVLQQPAVVLLVPGTIGFLSFGSLVDQNVTRAVTTLFQMLTVALTLSIGALLARVALAPVMAGSPRR